MQRKGHQIAPMSTTGTIHGTIHDTRTGAKHGSIYSTKNSTISGVGFGFVNIPVDKYARSKRLIPYPINDYAGSNSVDIYRSGHTSIDDTYIYI